MVQLSEAVFLVLKEKLGTSLASGEIFDRDISFAIVSPQKDWLQGFNFDGFTAA